MVLRLQRSAGNQAVARMLLQRQADDAGEAVTDEDIAAAEEEGEEEGELMGLGPEDALEGPVVEGEGEEPSPAGKPQARTFEPPGPPEAGLLQRTVNLQDAGSPGGWREMPRPEREAFARARFRGRRRSLAFRVMADMASATAGLRFDDLDELYAEVLKRVTSSVADAAVPGARAAARQRRPIQAFGYPFSGSALLYGPRVNYSARNYWTPRPPDAYARRTDRVRNRRLASMRRGATATRSTATWTPTAGTSPTRARPTRTRRSCASSCRSPRTSGR